MSFEIVNDAPYYQRGLGVLPLPLFILAGGAAAGAAITQALDTGWSTGEYNYWMKYMDSTIQDWDKVGWDKGCWAKNPSERRRWLDFWHRFSEHYGQGLMTDDLYLLDRFEKPAKELLKELRDWSARLNALCGASTTPIGGDVPAPGQEKPPSNPLLDLLKWGTYAVGAVLALNVFQTFKPRR